MSTQNEAVVRRFIDEVCNGRNLDVADELFTPTAQYHDPQIPNVPPGPQGIKETVATYQRAFSDAHWGIDEVISAGDRVILRWTGRGTHDNELQGIPPTGKQVTVAGHWIFRLEGGRIAEHWDVWDTLGMLQQLGVVPAMAQA